MVHIWMTVASQVYNNISEQDVATHAVNETAGMVPVYPVALWIHVFFNILWLQPTFMRYEQC